MPVMLKQSASLFDENMMDATGHVLLVLPPEQPADLPYGEVLRQRLARSRSTYADLAKKPLLTDLPQGGAAAWLVLDPELDAFRRHTLLRKALKPLLDEKPAHLHIAVYGDDEARAQRADHAEQGHRPVLVQVMPRAVDAEAAEVRDEHAREQRIVLHERARQFDPYCRYQRQ